MEIEPIQILGRSEKEELITSKSTDLRNDDEITLPEIKEKKCSLPDFDDELDLKEDESEDKEEEEKSQVSALFGDIKAVDNEKKIPTSYFIYAGMALSLLKYL